MALGASDAINYTRTPDWEKEVLRLSGGRGVDCVVEVGGGGHVRPVPAGARRVAARCV